MDGGSLRADNGLAPVMFHAAPDGIMAARALRDERGEVVDALIINANGKAAEYVGLPVKELIGASLLKVLPSLRGGTGWPQCLRVMRELIPERFRMRCGLHGLDTWFQATVVPIPDGFMMTLSDVTYFQYALFELEVIRRDEAEQAREEVKARELTERELRRLAVADQLTGVLNRRGFEEAVRTAAARCLRSKHPLSVVALDIDQLKQVNDRHGHAAGDAVLMHVAAILMEAMRRDSDTVARIGGEEFMLLLPGTPKPAAAAVAERLRAKIEAAPVPVGTGAATVTASFGVQDLGPDGDHERMVTEAEKALAQAKRAGRNRVVTAGRPKRSAEAAKTLP
jgi:diguanylate cyclase (GGDEF)-like protein